MFRALCVIAACAATAGCSISGPAAPSMSTYGYAFGPPAFYEFCEREKSLCATEGKKKAVELTPELGAELVSVNSEINRRFSQVNDAGSGDVWRRMKNSGDCEDFAIEKKSRLMEMGWPASTLLLTVVQPRFGSDGHTVLTVKTTEGDYILDNRTSQVKLWSKTPYRFFARQSQEHHGEWEQIIGL